MKSTNRSSIQAKWLIVKIVKPVAVVRIAVCNSWQKQRNFQMPEKSYKIEFFGGPCDGHLETSAFQPVHLAVDVVFLVCENALRILNGAAPRPGRSLTSVALYELQYVNGNARYRFVGAIPGKDFLVFV